MSMAEDIMMLAAVGIGGYLFYEKVWLPQQASTPATTPSTSTPGSSTAGAVPTTASTPVTSAPAVTPQPVVSAPIIPIIPTQTSQATGGGTPLVSTPIPNTPAPVVTPVAVTPAAPVTPVVVSTTGSTPTTSSTPVAAPAPVVQSAYAVPYNPCIQTVQYGAESYCIDSEGNYALNPSASDIPTITQSVVANQTAAVQQNTFSPGQLILTINGNLYGGQLVPNGAAVETQIVGAQPNANVYQSTDNYWTHATVVGKTDANGNWSQTRHAVPGTFTFNYWVNQSPVPGAIYFTTPSPGGTSGLGYWGGWAA
jgi:hypothetical protein